MLGSQNRPTGTSKGSSSGDGQGRGLGAQATSRKEGRMNGAPVCLRTPGAPWVLNRSRELSS